MVKLHSADKKIEKLMSNRITYFDALRGIAIIGVVAIHSSGGVSYPANNLSFNITIFWRQLLNFSVPLFLAISGYFMSSKELKDYKSYFNFLNKRLIKVYIPCLFWSILYCVLAVVLNKRSFTNEFIKAFTFQSFGHYYFIALIIQFYFFHPFLQTNISKGKLIIYSLLSLLSIATIFYIRYFTNYELGLLLYAGIFPTWIIFYTYGIYIGKFGQLLKKNNFIITCLCLTYFLSIFETYYLFSVFVQAGDAVTAVKVSSFLFSFFAISFLFNNLNVFNIPSLAHLGFYSFGIYLIHGFALRIVSKSMDITQIENILHGFTQFIVFPLVVFICYNFIKIANRTFNRYLLAKVGL